MLGHPKRVQLPLGQCFFVPFCLGYVFKDIHGTVHIYVHFLHIIDLQTTEKIASCTLKFFSQSIQHCVHNKLPPIILRDMLELQFSDHGILPEHKFTHKVEGRVHRSLGAVHFKEWPLAFNYLIHRKLMVLATHVESPLFAVSTAGAAGLTFQSIPLGFCAGVLQEHSPIFGGPQYGLNSSLQCMSCLSHGSSHLQSHCFQPASSSQSFLQLGFFDPYPCFFGGGDESHHA
mmetsp:Transcript_4287/g.27313  ORF Transcript_4287/g.27313 Transcript_4287/m.27313 type:complete len:231 (-) Transcript_4287:291-983(-)